MRKSGRKRARQWLTIGGVLAATVAFGAASRASDSRPAPAPGLVERLSGIRGKVMGLEQELIEGVRQQKAARTSIRKIQTLLKLQREERELGQRRLSELEKTIGELEARRGVLREKIQVHQRSMRTSLREIERSMREEPLTPRLPEREQFEAPRRKVLANLVDRGLKEIETFKVDLSDADQLETRIQDERQQLAYLFQDLKEQEGVLELNRQLQSDMLKRNHAERVSQLESYRRLKGAESQVERLIGDFNARIELERATETERTVSRLMSHGEFAKLKGKLQLPVKGKIISSFGRVFDVKSGLHIFKKGVDIATAKKEPVYAVSAGKVAYSGELPDYGRLTIIDHGEHFYSLCAHLGELHKKAGDPVAPGDSIGLSDEAGTPIYFEIRARNVAVNPLQWLVN